MWLVEKIEISGGFLPGLSIRVPPGLTCIIGARGSGTSTLAGAVRGSRETRRPQSPSHRDEVFAGLSVEETAATLNVSPQTVLRDWSLAKAWLNREMTKAGHG